MTPLFRYFLGFRVDPAAGARIIAPFSPVPGGTFRPLELDKLHLTLCVIAETPVPHVSIRDWLVQAFETGLPPASEIRFGRILRRANGAELVTTGSIAGIRRVYERIVALLDPLASRGIAPLHRTSGLRPHITLGYGKCPLDRVPVVWHWMPRELVLIESLVGRGIHRVLQSWMLEAPAQHCFGFLRDDQARSRPRFP
ncbi:2'-5' RNA ligase family protein [Sphingopyxis sp. PET50]|uniref:2'-5' RNA ligase family protein n=1 Tax=Sphingopyxis sp. PET50 TaxID=2976533 RepID=UPI0021AFAAF7|nr:hypothetical protein [Sphingopyxis sp. PET50]